MLGEFGATTTKLIWILSFFALKVNQFSSTLNCFEGSELMKAFLPYAEKNLLEIRVGLMTSLLISKGPASM